MRATIRWILTAMLALSASGVAWMFLGDPARDGLIGNANVLDALMGVAALIAAVLLGLPALRRDRSSMTAEQARSATERLASEVLRFWVAEAKTRGIITPIPAAVRWRWARTAVAAPASDMQCDVLTSGVVTSLRTELYERLQPPARLVVIGGPGSGKTTAMMLLLIDILRNRTADSEEPVPVWLTLGSWNPETTPLLDWAADILARDYLGLRPHDRTGRELGEQLLRSRKVALFLDGLDEMPDSLRIAALSALDQDAATLHVVLTCRSREYETAVKATRLWSTAVIELLPVELDQAAAFLLAEQIGARRVAWEQVTQHMSADPDSVVARTLTSPLALSLARHAYAQSDPSRMLDEASYRDPESLNRHLLMRTLNLAYPDRREREHAVYWLGWLAGRMMTSRELPWWDIPRWRTQRRLPLAAPGVWLLAVLGLCGWAVGHRAGIGWLSTSAVVLLGPAFVLTLWDLAFRISCDRPPLRLVVRWPRRLWLVGVPLALVSVPELTAFDFRGAEQAAPTALLLLAFLLPTVLVFAWTAPLAAAGVATPWQAYTADRRRTLIVGPASAATTGAIVCFAWYRATGSPLLGEASVLALGTGLCTGLILSAGATLGLWFVQSVIRLRGRSVSFMRLLRTAAERQVLRQAGSVYQFRHAELQDLLARVEAGTIVEDEGTPDGDRRLPEPEPRPQVKPDRHIIATTWTEPDVHEGLASGWIYRPETGSTSREPFRPNG
ncbi:NACHT domain-containing protein [Actinoplanes italicus]|uniref:NACHT domain-containing protein n=1 Tax=Actinoplanes italicus TaxID=113567 RepID=A0A2T0JZC0_9ACTN|nr:NACHT domain-containing protein [Actinoplanes italicus]PRX15851.1 NACHT domain-containing protein [Actinoplanes italicus]